MFPEFAKKAMADAGALGLKRTLRAAERVSPREIVIGGRHLLDFSSNDYMALSMRPELIEGACEWTRRYGAGSAASRLVSGTTEACLELEAKIAKWKGFEAAMILSSGYAGNVGLIAALSGRSRTIFADKLNHASLNQGCLLSGGDFKRYAHCDFERLEQMVARDGNKEKLIVSDTVFSMDGDVADLGRLRGIAEKNHALLYLDDAHGSGVLGENGHGLASPGLCDVALSTFSKALGSFGSCVCCSAEMKDYLVNHCASFIFSTAMPPTVLGAVSAAVDLMYTDEMKQARQAMFRRADYLRRSLNEMGFDTGKSETMIVPLLVGETERTTEFSMRLQEEGILGVAIRPPTVPRGTARIRLSLNAAHTDADVEHLIEAVRRISADHGNRTTH